MANIQNDNLGEVKDICNMKSNFQDLIRPGCSWLYAYPLFLILLFITNFPPYLNAQTITFEKLCDHYHRYVDQQELAGIVLCIEKKGKLMKEVYGYQNMSTRKPMTESSLFRIASMTKPIIAVAIMQLVESNRIRLDDEAARYIPQISEMALYNGTPKGKKPNNVITIRHLLSHTSGSTSAFDNSDAGQAAGLLFKDRRVKNLEELTSLICKTQLAFEPGEGWAYGYSNDLLAAIIERVSGVPVDQYLKKYIFGPLQMHNTSFQAPDTNRLTSIHAFDVDGKMIPVGNLSESRYVNGSNFPRGNGGLVTTAGDYLNFCRMILNQGSFNNHHILKPETIELMTSNVVDERFKPIKIGNNELKGHGYGLGFGILDQDIGFGTKGDVYWPGLLYTYFFVSPQNDLIGIFMTQLLDPSKINLVFEFHDLATRVATGLD